MTTTKYDRQIRLWGSSGQQALMGSKLLLLGCECSGVEAIKNLALSGIGEIYIVDNEIVSLKDLDSNFFVAEKDLKLKRAEVVCKYILEMNPDVKSFSIIKDPNEFIKEENLEQFNLIIINELEEHMAIEISRICKQRNINFIYLYTMGLVGYVRIFGNNHTIFESKPPDSQIDDLRIREPFLELFDYASSFDFSTMNDMEHGHIPYIVILIKCLDIWKKNNEGRIPESFKEKSEFKDLIKSQSRNISTEENFLEASKNYYKAFKLASDVPESVKKIFDSSFCNEADENSKEFWILAKALKNFFEKFNSLPLIGKLPDMTSLTNFYVKLQSIFKQKASKDFMIMKELVEKIDLKKKVSSELLSTFCENCLTLEFIHFSDMHEEITATKSIDYFENDCYKWFIAMKGWQKFYEINRKKPTNDDINELENIVNKEIIKKRFPNILPLENVFLQEIIRYENCKLITIGSLIGGVAGQEAIKLISKQFVPLNNTLIFNGISCEATVLQL